MDAKIIQKALNCRTQNPTSLLTASRTLSDSAGLAGWITAAVPAAPVSGSRSNFADGSMKPTQTNTASLPGICGGESVNVGGASESTCAHCKISNLSLNRDALEPQNPNYTVKPPSTILPGASKKRNKKQPTACELALSRVDNKAGGSQYRHAVKFFGTGSRREKPHLAHLISSSSSASVRGQSVGSGVNSVDSGGSRGTSPPQRHTYSHYGAPKGTSQNDIDSRINEC